MDGNPDFQAGFDLLLCYYALGDKDRMKKAFLHLMSIEHEGNVEEDEEEVEEDPGVHKDGLKEELREREKHAKHFVTVAGKLIAPAIEPEWHAGYDWVVENLKTQVCAHLNIWLARIFIDALRPYTVRSAQCLILSIVTRAHVPRRRRTRTSPQSWRSPRPWPSCTRSPSARPSRS